MLFRRAFTLYIIAIVFVAITVVPDQTAYAVRCPQAAIALKAGNALIAAAKAGSPSRFAQAFKRFADMPRIARFGLGRHRRALRPSRQAAFTQSVTILISRTFNQYRLKFRAHSIEFVDCRGSKVYTRMFFLGGRGHQPVIWRFRGNRITDVNVQSLWLGQLLRDYINGEMKKHDGDIEAVMREMRS
jgi:ABC-type transporter MlaC component